MSHPDTRRSGNLYGRTIDDALLPRAVGDLRRDLQIVPHA